MNQTCRTPRTVGCRTSFGPPVPETSLRKLPGCAHNKRSILTMKIQNIELKNHGIAEVEKTFKMSPAINSNRYMLKEP